jgi:PAS domain S-box-containing protein
LDHNAIVIADSGGMIRFWNAAAQNAFGHEPQQAIGQSLDMIVPPQYREAHWKGFRAAMASGKAAAEGQPGPFPVRRADGKIIVARGRLTLLRDPEGLVIAAVVLFEQAAR